MEEFNEVNLRRGHTRSANQTRVCTLNSQQMLSQNGSPLCCCLEAMHANSQQEKEMSLAFKGCQVTQVRSDHRAWTDKIKGWGDYGAHCPGAYRRDDTRQLIWNTL